MSESQAGTLTATDMGILIEAVDAWVNKGSAGELMSSMIGMMMSKDKDAFLAEQEERRTQRDEVIKERQRTATLLKAKLIMLEEEMSGSKLFAAATKSEEAP